MKKDLIDFFDNQSSFKKPLMVFDMANNHNGDVNHGIKIIQKIYEVCEEFMEDFIFGFKFQYRDLDTFIHPDYKERMDIKYVKRFSETRLSDEDFKLMKDEVERLGFVSICTPFDENSVDLIERYNFDIIKVASCAFTDWPLLEKIAETDKPIIASTAGATLKEIDSVVSFLEHRNKKAVIMHCVGEYPTKVENLQLNQIGFLRKRYPEMIIGFSTHEEPDNLDSIKIAIAKEGRVFERHVAVESDKYPINGYSSTPSQIKKWLQSAREAYKIGGVENDRHPSTEKEKKDLRGLKRGVFVKEGLKEGDKLTKENTFYAIPCSEEQLIANDISKYVEYILKRDIGAKEVVNSEDLEIKNSRARVLEIIGKLKEIVIESHVALPPKVDLELSHHYGIEKFEEYGATILNCINREYCKKLIILLPKQKHPSHYHKKKEETFQVLYGEMNLTIGGKEKLLHVGDMQTVERGVPHNFSSEEGCVFEEISTRHYKDDSFYEDEEITKKKDRKTEMTFWPDWLIEDLN